MYRGCVFFHFRLHLSAIVPMSPTWIVTYVLLGWDICSPADYHHITPPPFSIPFIGQYYSMFVHVCKTHTSYTFARCISRCVSPLPHFLASGCFRYYITKSSLLCIIHNGMLFRHFVISPVIFNVGCFTLPAGAP